MTLKRSDHHEPVIYFLRRRRRESAFIFASEFTSPSFQGTFKINLYKNFRKLILSNVVRKCVERDGLIVLELAARDSPEFNFSWTTPGRCFQGIFVSYSYLSEISNYLCFLAREPRRYEFLEFFRIYGATFPSGT
jgi:hypothetical protein